MALIGAAFGLGFTFGPLIGAAALLSSSSVGESPWPGYVAAGLSGMALLLAVFLLPESLRPDRQRAHHDWFDARALRDALATPSIPALLIASFVSVLSFGGFETTLAVLLEDHEAGFGFALHQVLLYFAFIGLTLTFAQGGLVRQLAKRMSERALATAGGVISMLGFALLVWAVRQGGLALLMIASAVEVIGFAFITPSLQSLISRRSDPAKQGGILGISQSISALARIAGPLVALPLYFQQPSLPYLASMVLMLVGLAILLIGVRGGRDYTADSP
jgi:MFS family permease